MALAKKGLRTICVGGEEFVWKVRRKMSHEEKCSAQLCIPIQHISGGQLFIAHLDFSRSGYEAYGIPGAGILKNITPSIIENCINTAINLGWQFKRTGKPISILDGKLVSDTLVSRWLANRRICPIYEIE